MQDFTLALALYDFVPVLLTAIGLWWLVRYVADHLPAALGMAALGALLILLGGLAKALWKLLAATLGLKLPWLSEALFPLMAPGFVLLAVALWSATQPARLSQRGRWLLALGVLLAAGLAVGLRQWVLEIPRGWFLPLLTLASLGSLGVNLLLIAAAVRLRRWEVVVLLALNLAMVFALQPMARAGALTLRQQWIEQSLTAFGGLCFALGIWWLWKAAMQAEIRARRALLRQRAEH
ncbi:MAG: hypothetical protein JXM75_08455 [Chromatiaceae bacterium]|nr:hypothetical protein [Chromatiaceae bacterium]